MERRRYNPAVRALITGFRPWGRLRRNPRGEVAEALGGHVLPVDFDQAERDLLGLIRKLHPEAILMMGLAEGRRRIEIEALAMNLRGADGPLRVKTRLPVEAIRRRLAEAGIPVRVSLHAGTFVCNHVFYVGLRATDVACGFVHVPPAAAVRIREQIRAIRLVLEEIDRSQGSQGLPSRMATSWP